MSNLSKVTPTASDPFEPCRDTDETLIDLPDGWEMTFTDLDSLSVSFQFRGPGSLPDAVADWAKRVTLSIDADKCDPKTGKHVYTVMLYPRDEDDGVPADERRLIGPPKHEAGSAETFDELLDLVSDLVNTVSDPDEGDHLVLDGKIETYD